MSKPRWGQSGRSPISRSTASGWWVNREFGVAWTTRGGKLELTRTAADALKKSAEFIAEVEVERDLH